LKKRLGGKDPTFETKHGIKKEKRKKTDEETD